MKRFLITKWLLLTFVTPAPLLSMGQGKLPVDAAAPANIKIDGKLNEWEDKPFNADRTGKISYLVSNDDKNLYILVKTADQSVIMRIVSAGMTVAVNPKGKKKETYAITFPVLSQKDMGRPDQFTPGTERPDMKSMQQSMRSKMVIIGVKGFPLIDFDQISVYNNYGIKTAIDFDEQNNLCYEAAIPLNLLSLSLDQPYPIACNIKINGLKMPEMPGEPGGGMGSPPGGGMGGPLPVEWVSPPGGGMGGPPGGMRNMNGDTGEMLKSTDFWVVQTLVKP